MRVCPGHFPRGLEGLQPLLCGCARVSPNPDWTGRQGSGDRAQACYLGQAPDASEPPRHKGVQCPPRQGPWPSAGMRVICWLRPSGVQPPPAPALPPPHPPTPPPLASTRSGFPGPSLYSSSQVPPSSHMRPFRPPSVTTKCYHGKLISLLVTPFFTFSGEFSAFWVQPGSH